MARRRREPRRVRVRDITRDARDRVGVALAEGRERHELTAQPRRRARRARDAHVERRIHALGPTGRIAGAPVLLGDDRETLVLGESRVPLAAEGDAGARVFPAAGTVVAIEGLPVPA